ncbi:MAG: hypothetical protein GC158_15765 [Cyanobacteria bacterium RI_101]|nr:hypothetical protein [Cyanobacteria bacterium RI_101]
MENPGQYRADADQEQEVYLPTQPLLREEEKSNNIRQISYRSGPIEPDELKAYDDLAPGFAEKYLNELFVGAEHQRKLELLEIDQEKLALEIQREIFEKNHRRSLLASQLGALVIIVAILTAGGLAYLGKEKTATAIIGSLAVVSGLIYGTDAYNRGKEKQLKTSKETEKGKSLPEEE